MVAEQALAVGVWQEGEDVPESFSEIGDRHIRSADEAVAGADNGADSGRLPVCREEEVYAGGEGAAGLIPDHQEVGAERHRHAGDGEERGHELRAHTAVDDGVGHRCARQVTFSRTNRKSYTDLGGEPRENK